MSKISPRDASILAALAHFARAEAGAKGASQGIAKKLQGEIESPEARDIANELLQMGGGKVRIKRSSRQTSRSTVAAKDILKWSRHGNG